MTSSMAGQKGLNEVVLTGKVAPSPKFHHQPDGRPVLQFFLELNESPDEAEPKPAETSRGQGGRRKAGHRSLIPVIAFGSLAQSRMALRIGDHLLVRGQLHQRRWETPEGRTRDRIEVIAKDLRLVEENQKI